ncbi:transmembrane amino acid transporter protein-domain-containing protein [Radiomyces spectabilis]|uniref:transmembrane amino acid transporter protein-domain-containing protein n=1 Tax=Radiomyces spectabilis TaxID=64574 RepID=UPI00221EA2D4|nr:transmembrane amino acid transporter protein-domain-containing protein [Radiomyces spectabilis]KAI8380993.1 transmembrane amino acid transporter protein-domain-containing protein [Radiomyces spectabilis]
MSSLRPENAKIPNTSPSTGEDDNHLSISQALQDNGLSTSFDRASSTARLSSSPIPPSNLYGTSPAGSLSSFTPHHYGSSLPRDIEPASTSHSGTSRAMFGDHLTTEHQDHVAKAVKRHLVETSPAGSIYGSSPNRSLRSHGADIDDDTNHQSDHESGSEHRGVTNIHQLPGGAITHEIYKWTETVENERRSKQKRSQSVYYPRTEPSDPALVHIKDPGGFRRHFVVDKAAREGKAPPHWMTRTFVDFLALYGHFGGEDLSDDEDEDDEALAARRRRNRLKRQQTADDLIGEQTPLIERAQENAVQGTATPSKAVFLLLKSFIGTGVMFLPKAFYNGGLFFSSIVLSVIAGVSLYSFLLLVETRNKVPVSFGDIGGILFGPAMRMLVLTAITVSQIGFVCAYMVFVAQNLQALIEAVSNCEMDVPLSYLIWLQIAIFVPLAMIRKIQKLSVFALIADVFILLGLAYLYYYDFFTLATKGIGNIIWMVNPSSFPLFIGTAVFTFEGVGLIIPITESMAEPKKFPKVLSGTMIGVTLLFLSVGFISYLTFGDEVQTVILLNLPANPLVNTIQGLYAVAICLSIPLQLFPAIRIVETGLFTRSGKNNPVVKWEKNIFRLMTVVVCALVATAGSADLDKFVSLIGSVCCVPLCFLFPPLFHLKGIAKTWQQRTIDIVIIIFGLASMIYTTAITVSLWSAEGEAAPPISRCIPHGV